ncbi:transglutaminase TgpA family protein [Herbiconiux liangxiaofengii]|uniref:transglutaminase TgpA family protein n=1 Tax=Herbiconiux liangxiaofengii TaxID=3342795 RepID=UPI0035BB8C7A
MSTTLRPPAAPDPGFPDDPRGRRRGPTSAPGSPSSPPRSRNAAAAARRRERSGSWKTTAAVGLTIVIALFGLAPLLQGLGWWVATAAMVAVLLTFSALLRSRGLPEVVVIALAALLWLALVVLLYAPDSTWLVLPTLDTVNDIAGDLAVARESIAVQEVPALAVPEITQLLVMSIGLIALVSDELATGLRVPALSGVGPLAVLSITPLVRRDEPQVTVYALTAVAFLLVLWTGSRIGVSRGDRRSAGLGSIRPTAGGRNPGLAVGIAAAAVAALVVLPTVTPGLTARDLTDQADRSPFASVYATGVDPTIQLGRDLRRSDPVLSLTYTTTSEDGLYLKMVNLSDFTQGEWQPESPYEGDGYDGGAFGPPPGLAADVPVTDVTTSVSIAGLRSDWLPLPYPTQQVDDLPGDWLLTPETFTVTDLQSDTQGINYTATSLAVAPTAEQLAAAGETVPDSLSGYLGLPAGLPPVIAELAATVTAGAVTNYDRAVSLQEYFRSGEFRYSLSAPASDGYDGSNADMIAAFLDQKEGYCVHFSAAMAVMARTLGIPSRIAVGYAPGQTADSTADGEPVYEVYTDQLHAWPELYFEGIGWLPFEPTPGLNITPPDYSLPDYAQQSATGSAAPAPSSTSTATNSAGPERGDVGASASAEQQVLAQVRGWSIFAGILVVAAVVVLAPFLARRFVRRRRIRRLATDPLPGTLAWLELEDTLDDHRLQRSAGDTMSDVERRLTAENMVPADAIERLRLVVEFEQYAPPGSAGDETRRRIAGDLEAVISGLDARAETRERTLARLLPVSLVRRRRRRSTSTTGTLVP